MVASEIVVHHSLSKDSETVSWGAIRKFHMTDPNYMMVDIGYHAGIELVGVYYEILLGRMWNDMGAHTKGHNHYTLGICFVGNFDDVAPPRGQLVVGAKLIKYWMRIFNIPIENVRPHSFYAPHKSCPGKLFGMNNLKELVLNL